MTIIKVKIFVLILFPLSVLFAQDGIIKGKVVDELNSPVTGANVYLQGTVRGSSSDKYGFFEIKKLPYGNYTLSVSVIGYHQQNIEIKIESGEALDLGIVWLQSMPLQSAPVVVTASKYQQNLQDVPMSISSVDAKALSDRNSITVDDALKYVSGINMNADQVNIRGSSGYSKGVGSRVMMLVDGVPYIAGDTQGLIFEAMPVNNIERLEIIKGAGSALYGSNAIGGVINIITKPISATPQLGINIYGGFYSDPYYSEWKWSDDARYLHGIRVDYSRKMEDLGFRMSLSRDQNDDFRKNGWKERYNFSGKIEYDFSALERLTITGNYMDQQRGNFLFWKDLKNALVPPDDQLDDEVHSKRSYLSSSFRKIITNEQFYKITAIWYHNYFKDNIGTGGNSTSDYFNAEFQFNTKYEKHFLTFGITPTINKLSSNIFGSSSGLGLAAYVQDEIKWSEKWISTLGGRFDYFDIDSLWSNYRFNPKVGIVYKPGTNTSLRASFGTGFREPSMAEAFSSTEAGGLPVKPNYNLKPESSLSVEVGWNEIVDPDFITDISFFYNSYWDLIEGGFHKDTLNYIQFNNITKARIAGFEANLHWWAVKNKLLINLGYTYIDPRNITNDDYLNYRPRHLLYLKSDWEYGIFKLGVDYRYISRYDRIDEVFALYISDAEERVAAQIVDLRLLAEFELDQMPIELSLQVNNVFQYHYVDLIGAIAPIRNYILSLDAEL